VAGHLAALAPDREARSLYTELARATLALATRPMVVDGHAAIAQLLGTMQE
jgi:hypothetical protein